MPWKMDGEHVALEGGNPVWEYTDGKTAPVDFAKSLDKIGTLNAENKTHREAKEALETELKPWKALGMEVVAVTEAVNTVKNLGDKKLIDAGKVDEVKAEANKTLQAQLTAKETEYTQKLAAKDEVIRGLTIGHHFDSSPVIVGEKSIFHDKVPPDMLRQTFSPYFSNDEKGTVVAYLDPDTKKQPIYSRTNPGEYADFDEALPLIVEKYRFKDTILKGDSSGGSGVTAGKQTAKTPASELQKLDPTERLTAAWTT